MAVMCACAHCRLALQHGRLFEADEIPDERSQGSARASLPTAPSNFSFTLLSHPLQSPTPYRGKLHLWLLSPHTHIHHAWLINIILFWSFLHSFRIIWYTRVCTGGVGKSSNRGLICSVRVSVWKSCRSWQSKRFWNKKEKAVVY